MAAVSSRTGRLMLRATTQASTQPTATAATDSTITIRRALRSVASVLLRTWASRASALARRSAASVLMRSPCSSSTAVWAPSSTLRAISTS